MRDAKMNERMSDEIWQDRNVILGFEPDHLAGEFTPPTSQMLTNSGTTPV